MTRRIVATHDGATIEAVTLTTPAGATADILNWGAVVRDMLVPTASGPRRVVLGFPDFAPYPEHSPHFGAIAGRFANRIEHGRFTLDGVTHQLPLNQEGRHSLHGGGMGFGKRPWSIQAVAANSVTLGLVSPAGDHGYPGEMIVTCRYSLVDKTTLRVELTAVTDQPTIVNLCHHSYFNLDGGADILDHYLQVDSDFITPVDADRIPSGEIQAVAGGAYDFRAARPIRFPGTDGQRHLYDQNYMLRRDIMEPAAARHMKVARAATLASARSRLAMEVWTTEPAIQVYDGYKLATTVPGLDGKAYGPAAGIALEPQHAPNSPNIAHFPSTTLRPGEVYRQVTEYRFRPAVGGDLAGA